MAIVSSSLFGCVLRSALSPHRALTPWISLDSPLGMSFSCVVYHAFASVALSLSDLGCPSAFWQCRLLAGHLDKRSGREVLESRWGPVFSAQGGWATAFTVGGKPDCVSRVLEGMSDGACVNRDVLNAHPLLGSWYPISADFGVS